MRDERIENSKETNAILYLITYGIQILIFLIGYFLLSKSVDLPTSFPIWVFVILIGLAVSTWLYILPALLCHSQYKILIYILCLFFTPTLLGWILLIVWAVMSNQQADQADALQELQEERFQQYNSQQGNGSSSEMKEIKDRIFQLKLLRAQESQESQKEEYDLLIEEAEAEYRQLEQDLLEQEAQEERERIQAEKEENRSIMISRLLTVVLFVVVITGGFAVWQSTKPKTTSQTSVQTTTSQTSSSTIQHQKETTNLTEEELFDWVLAVYASDSGKTVTKTDYTISIGLGGDDLAYAILRDSTGKNVGRYRVNANGQLEKQFGDSWEIVSKQYKTLQD